MLRYLLKLFGALFVIFIIVGNIVAPAEVRQQVSVGEPEGGVQKVFFDVGKFVITPFKTLQYRLGERSNDYNYNDFNGKSGDTVFQGRIWKYVEVDGRKYPVYWDDSLEPVNNSQNRGSINLHNHEELWIDDDVKNPVVVSVAKTSFKLLYNDVTEEDKKVIEKYWAFPTVPKPIGAPADDPFSVNPYIGKFGLPFLKPSPSTLRAYYIPMTYRFAHYGIGSCEPGENPASKVITSEKYIPVDCDCFVRYTFEMLYNLNKMLGIRAEYYEMSIFSNSAPYGHAELLVYYPDTGKWELYATLGISMQYYALTGVDAGRYIVYDEYLSLLYDKDKKKAEEFGKIFDIPTTGSLNRPLSGDEFYVELSDYIYAEQRVMVVKRDNGIEQAFFVPAGMLQFDSLKDAIYWYLYNWKVLGIGSGDGVPGLPGASGDITVGPKFKIDIFELDTPETKVHKTTYLELDANSPEFKAKMMAAGKKYLPRVTVWMGEAPDYLKKPDLNKYGFPYDEVYKEVKKDNPDAKKEARTDVTCKIKSFIKALLSG